MRASAAIHHVWCRFRGIPTETFTKGWWLKQCGGVARQRTVAEIREHRRRLGAGGNCFDVALWVRDELAEAGGAVLVFAAAAFIALSYRYPPLRFGGGVTGINGTPGDEVAVG